MDIIVATFEQKHISECVQLYQKVFQQEPWNDNDSNEAVTEYFRNFIKSDMFMGHVAFYENKIIALSVGFIKPWVKGLEYYIDQFCVDTDLQCKGIGSEFLLHIKRELIKKGINNIFLLTNRQFPSYKFYKKNGFTELENFCCMAN